MAKSVALGGRITRRYVQLKLNRDRRQAVKNGYGGVTQYIDSLKAWLTAQPKRTSRPGGIGRKLARKPSKVLGVKG